MTLCVVKPGGSGGFLCCAGDNCNYVLCPADRDGNEARCAAARAKTRNKEWGGLGTSIFIGLCFWWAFSSAGNN